VVTTLTFTANGPFPTLTKVWGTNAGWTTYRGTSTRALTFTTGYSAVPLLY
jgi:hypothetical protein